MARPPRLDPPMGWHHVFNRRVAELPLFRSDGDREDFLGLLAPLDPRFGVEVHAYALLDARYDLLVRSRRGGLSAAMRDLQHRWSLKLTHRYQEVGPVFQGRYGSRLLVGVAELADALAQVRHGPGTAGQTSWPEPARWTTLPVSQAQGPMSARQTPEQAQELGAEGILDRVETVTGLSADNLGDPRVGSGPNAALHLAIYALRQRTALTQRQIGGLLGLTGRQVAWIVAAQARGLRPEVERLLVRFDAIDA